MWHPVRAAITAFSMHCSDVMPADRIGYRLFINVHYACVDKGSTCIELERFRNSDHQPQLIAFNICGAPWYYDFVGRKEEMDIKAPKAQRRSSQDCFHRNFEEIAARYKVTPLTLKIFHCCKRI
ncbi:hypothetical protein TNIN_199291 [Trichonephila inaurata madagascariensis]|uniref:Uncharacterized protein n=1 Tax=Trichonephila inaurata madagascariensis TaxID=2747483 RepID=A0A8X6X2K3_9ARAC|nr:hypothetical protein TNIN_199291 [Trichonephila inaurata madagascariensis]